MAIQDDFNNIVGPVNEAGADLNVISRLWSSLTVTGKESVKAQYLAILEQAEVNITALKEKINSL